jgi:hypothetical protein
MSLRRLALLSLVLGAAACADTATSIHDVEVSDATDADAADAGKADANDLPTAQEKAARFQLDQICGDTWCDGDYDFSFKKVVCHFGKGSCTVTMLIHPYTEQKPVPVYWRSCKVGGLHAFEDLVDTAPSGYQSIDQDFYDAMTDCTMKIVAKLPPAI